MIALDATPIAPRLYQGSYPAPSSQLCQAGFSLLVLAAVELQRGSYPGIEVVRVPLDDHRPEAFELALCWAAASLVYDRLKAGGKALVTCHQGRNRSGIITAATLMLGGLSAPSAVRLVKEKRRGALSNRDFVAHLLKVGRAPLVAARSKLPCPPMGRFAAADLLT